MSAPSDAQVLRALAQHLEDQGLAVYADVYPPGEGALPAVTFGRLPSAPILAVALNRYNTDTTTDSHNPYFYVQLRWRAKKLTAVEDLADNAFRTLHFFERTDPPRIYPGGVHVQRCTRVIAAPADPDANGNWERADSYQLTINPA